MENVLNDMFSNNSANENSQASTESNQEVVNHDFDLSLDDLQNDEETFDETNVGEAEVDNDEEAQLNSTNQAFAQMRTQNKEYSDKISQFDDAARALGLADANALLEQINQAKIKKEASEKGISVEMAQELAEMRDLKNSIIAEREESANEARINKFASNVQAFVDKNNLGKSAVDKLSQDLEADGVNIDTLMKLPVSALNKMLSAYTGTSYQKNLERKDAIKRELPVSQTSKIDVDDVNKEIDSFAKFLAGKY